MSCYHCDNCDGLKDDDWNPCHQSPFSTFGLICDDCHTENTVDNVWDKEFMNCDCEYNPHMGMG